MSFLNVATQFEMEQDVSPFLKNQLDSSRIQSCAYVQLSIKLVVVATHFLQNITLYLLMCHICSKK